MELPADDEGLGMSEAELELPDDDLSDLGWELELPDDDFNGSEWLLGQLEVSAESPDGPILPRDIC
eukprot:1767044-Lingulodinium_polyedra.AAC.1